MIGHFGLDPHQSRAGIGRGTNVTKSQADSKSPGTNSRDDDRDHCPCPFDSRFLQNSLPSVQRLRARLMFLPEANKSFGDQQQDE